MESSFDRENLRARLDALRRSEYFPALLGAAAGGLTGALIAALIARSKQRAATPPGAAAGSSARGGLVLGFTAGELAQLATLALSLARQIREWRARG